MYLPITTSTQAWRSTVRVWDYFLATISSWAKTHTHLYLIKWLLSFAEQSEPKGQERWRWGYLLKIDTHGVCPLEDAFDDFRLPNPRILKPPEPEEFAAVVVAVTAEDVTSGWDPLRPPPKSWKLIGGAEARRGLFEWFGPFIDEVVGDEDKYIGSLVNAPQRPLHQAVSNSEMIFKKHSNDARATISLRLSLKTEISQSTPRPTRQ